MNTDGRMARPNTPPFTPGPSTAAHIKHSTTQHAATQGSTGHVELTQILLGREAERSTASRKGQPSSCRLLHASQILPLRSPSFCCILLYHVFGLIVFVAFPAASRSLPPYGSCWLLPACVWSCHLLSTNASNRVFLLPVAASRVLNPLFYTENCFIINGRDAEPSAYYNGQKTMFSLCQKSYHHFTTPMY